MANRQGRNVTVGDFNPRGAMPDGPAPIARPDGSEAGRLASAYGTLADKAGDIADRAARIEGKRAGEIAGNDPAFRPSGSTTIRGAAADEAGIRAYSDNLDAKMRAGMTDLFRQHENDPNALKTALDEFKGKLITEDAFPEIAASTNAAFERLRLPFQIKALDNQQGRQRDELRASRVAADNAGATYIEQAARAAPDAPETRDVIEATIRREEAADRQAVASEAITAEQAETRRIKRRQKAEVDLVQGKAERLTTAEAVAEYRKSLTKDFTDGKTKLDRDSHAEAEDLLKKREQQLQSRRLQGVAELTNRMQAIIDQYKEGAPPSQDEIASVQARAVGLTDKSGMPILDDFNKRLQIVARSKSMEPSALDGWADNLVKAAREDGRGMTTEEAGRVKLIRDMADYRRKKLATDPVDLARREGLVDAPGMSIPDKPQQVADFVAAQMANRVAAGTAAARQPGATVTRYLTEDDKLTLRAIGNEGGERAVEIVRGIVKGAGADAPKILREIGGDLPELAKAGDILASGVPGGDRTAREIARGLELRKVDGTKRPTLPTDASRFLKEEIGPAVTQSEQAQIEKAARVIYEARVYGKGIDPKSPDAEQIYREALHSASGAGQVGEEHYGGVSTYKPPGWWYGSSKTAVPANVKRNSFADVVGAIRTEDLGGATDEAGNAITAAALRRAIPVRTSRGYMFAQNDPGSDNPKFIGKPGQPLVLDLDALAPELRKRVPDAYLGGTK